MSVEGEVPEDISCTDQVFDVALHPMNDFFAAALIDGSIEVWKYGVGETANQLLFKNNRHTSSCRGVKFNERGDVLYSISSDRSLRAIDGNGSEILSFNAAHDKPINRISCISEHTLVTGDDGGEVKLWDLRAGSQEKAAVMQWNLHEDFVSGFAYNPEAGSLISVSGDSTLCMYDLRNKKNHWRSDEQESELQCVQILKAGRKVVAGTQDGVMLLFSWDQWGDCSDRYPGHPEAVDCMQKIDESTVITGSSDGLLRVVSLLPNKILGVIGDHEEFPVEGLSASRDARLLASFAHDEIVRFWDISMFADDDGEDFDPEVPEMSGIKAQTGKNTAKSGKKATGAVPGVGADGDAESSDDEIDGEEGEEWGDMDSEDEGEDMEEEEGVQESAEEMDSSDSDSDGSSDEGPAKGRARLPTSSEKFFADL